MDDQEVRLLLEQLHPDSFGWALFCCRQQIEDAEDVLQTSYLKVLEGRARFEGQSTFCSWFFSVIRMTAIDAYRRKQRRRGLFLSHFRRNEEPATENMVDAGVRMSDIQIQVRQLLSRLSGRQQEVIQLAYYHELTIEEAAVVMHVSLGSARQHYARAKFRLRQLMKKYNDELCLTN